MSEKSVCFPQEKTLNKVSFVPISDMHKHIQREEGGRKRMEKDESKSTVKLNRQREQGGGSGAYWSVK